jgi:hypothetical protein
MEVLRTLFRPDIRMETETAIPQSHFIYVETLPSYQAGSNTSTVTLRVIRGDEKGSLKCETVKYGRESVSRNVTLTVTCMIT